MAAESAQAKLKRTLDLCQAGRHQEVGPMWLASLVSVLHIKASCHMQHAETGVQLKQALPMHTLTQAVRKRLSLCTVMVARELCAAFGGRLSKSDSWQSKCTADA